MSERTRWEKAQSEERKYQRISRSKLSSGPSQYLNKLYNLPSSFFYQQKVLEIGVAVWSTIHNLDGAILKVGIDPLANFYSEFYPRSAEHILGRGEELPFLHDSFDSIICLNTLDHTENPSLVLTEIRRCLKSGGTLLFSVHTFGLPKILRNNLLSKTDPTHPHHFEELEVLEMLHKSGFVLKHLLHTDLGFVFIKKTKDLIRGKRLRSALKYFIAKVFAGMNSTYIVCN
jgi:SAM-dependent methyltransferase